MSFQIKKSLKAAWILNLLRQIIADSRDTEHSVVATICWGIFLNKMVKSTDLLGTTDRMTGDKKRFSFLSIAGNIPAKPTVTRSQFQTWQRKNFKKYHMTMTYVDHLDLIGIIRLPNLLQLNKLSNWFEG